LLGFNLSLFFCQANKAKDRVYKSITPESLVSWRTWFIFYFRNGRTTKSDRRWNVDKI